MKKVISLFLLLYIFFNPPLAIAQISESNCILTKVGNPTEPSPACGAGGATLITEAADRIRQAYVTCGKPSGSTRLYLPTESYSLASCMRQSLSQYNYTSTQLDAFERSRASVIADGCSQCIGYVKSVVTLIDTSSNPFCTYCNASGVIAGDPISLRSGNYTYQKVEGDGNAADIQPGDIGVTKRGVWGHILIVKQVKDRVSFYAYQSHWKLDCMVTDNYVVDKEGYVFYRRNDRPLQ